MSDTAMNQARTLACGLRDDVAKRPGLLWRVGHMFSERGINIDEIAVHRSAEDTIMLVCFTANDQQLKQLFRRLERIDGIVSLQLKPSTQLVVTCR